MKNPIIEVSHLYFSYNSTPVLQDVSLNILEREFVAFIGPNGGGKTTLIKLLLGILKPDRGTIRIMGQPPAKSAHRIGYVPQDISINKSFPISVMDVVLMGRLQFHRWARISKQDRAAAENALESLDMLEFRDRRIDDLSGVSENAYLLQGL